jgi:RNA polymerase sigma-70 factor, ECF subfamily
VSSSEVLDIGQEGAVAAGAPEAQSERVLLSRLRRGDPEAFELLVREHQDRVFDFCVRMVGDREEASDLVQEIFVSVHQNLGKFREDSKLSTWIFRISKNQCINRLKYLKRRGRGRSDEYGEVGEDVLSGAIGAPPTPDAALESARERARVQRAISQLEPDARVLVALRDIEGLSYEEIIDITELPEGTVKSRLHRAREKLAELLGRLEE